MSMSPNEPIILGAEIVQSLQNETKTDVRVWRHIRHFMTQLLPRTPCKSEQLCYTPCQNPKFSLLQMPNIFDLNRLKIGQNGQILTVLGTYHNDQ